MTRPVFTIAADTPVYVALASMRETSSHLALVVDGDATVGVVTMSDVLSYVRCYTGLMTSNEAQ